jgi:hypothetical protein
MGLRTPAFNIPRDEEFVLDEVWFLALFSHAWDITLAVMMYKGPGPGRAFRSPPSIRFSARLDLLRRGGGGVPQLQKRGTIDVDYRCAHGSFLAVRARRNNSE